MKIDFFGQTDVGKVRKENQDSYGVLESERFFFVCDGMGGGAAGDFASRAAADIITASWDLLKKEDIEAITGITVDAMDRDVLLPFAAVKLANRALHSLADKYPGLSGMGTTFAGVRYDAVRNILHIYHVGDSRVYRIRNGNIELLTKDHSKVNELIDLGKMKEEEVKTAEIQSMITRALGTGPRVKVDYRAEHVRPNDLYVLCTDGLNGEIGDTIIKDIALINKEDVEQIADELICAANNMGGRDNTTVIALRAKGEADVKVAKEHYEFIEKVVTIGDETPPQTATEDHLLKKVMKAARIKVPASAEERSFLGNPLTMGILIAGILAGVTFMVAQIPRHMPEQKLEEISGKVSGIQLEVRTPAQGPWDAFKRSEDTIQRMQLVQDWLREKERHTVFLPEVSVTVVESGKEIYTAVSGTAPLTIDLKHGVYTVNLSCRGYRIMTERIQRKDDIEIPVEAGETHKQVTLLMTAE
jgi:PPM family protein phosphatase